jgi:CheY-like chemotaxis protein
MEEAMLAQSGAAKILVGENWTVVPEKLLEVLLVEDNEADAFLVCKALNGIPNVSQVIHARDGIEALDLLDGGMVAPDVAIIDLNMPHTNGHSLLTELRCRPEFNFTTIVLTSSGARVDAKRSRLCGANHFMTKPDTVERLQTMLAHVMSAI